MLVVALRVGDSAGAVDGQFTLHYIGSEAGSHQFEIAFSDRASFAVVTGKSVSVTTVWAHVPEPFAMFGHSELRIGNDRITVRELSGGKISVNYFGAGQFAAVHRVRSQAVKAGSSPSRL